MQSCLPYRQRFHKHSVKKKKRRNTYFCICKKNNLGGRHKIAVIVFDLGLTITNQSAQKVHIDTLYQQYKVTTRYNLQSFR